MISLIWEEILDTNDISEKMPQELLDMVIELEIRLSEMYEPYHLDFFLTAIKLNDGTYMKIELLLN